ncbi:sodium ion-translocating decarboxylase subunit beta [Proteiniborus sp.]|uniref:sodium ion-translocating decarboxylase subunit beta n=1 Tax=Proteiniborus sp. TaxID=2079015 RepID=UPI003325E70E
MDKRKLIKIVAIFTAITGIVTVIGLGFEYLLPIFLSFKLKREINHASSIGIIGGADGPTSIFLASQPSPHLFTGIFAFLTIVGVSVILIIRRSMK